MRKLFLLLTVFYCIVVLVLLCSCEKPVYTNPCLNVVGTWRQDIVGLDRNYNGLPDDSLSAVSGGGDRLVLNEGGSGQWSSTNAGDITWEVIDNNLLLRQNGAETRLIIRRITPKSLLLLDPKDSISRWLSYAKDP